MFHDHACKKNLYCRGLNSYWARPGESGFIREFVWILSAGLGTFCLAAPLAHALDPGELASNVVRSATESNWRQSSPSPLDSPGRNLIALSSCPPGVSGSEPAYYVYISGTGIPEAALVTGGTCKGNGNTGTLEFTTAHPHPPGYSIGSASGGVQEASIAARFTPSNPTGTAQSGKVVIPPGEYDVFAPISIRASGQTVEFQGAVLNCYTANGACLFVGDAKSSGLAEDVTLVTPRGRPMVQAGTTPFIEVNGQHTRIFNVTTRRAPEGAGFGSYVQVDDDQAFLLDGLDSNLGVEGVTCNPSFCGAFVTAPGPFNRWSAVGWLKHLNISLQCAGKGIDWQSGNGLRISDSVIQGWSVFGVRVSNQHGGFGGFISENVYYEAATSCASSSPYGNVGNAGILTEGIHVKISGLANNGASGSFPNWGSASGSHDWLYWVVPVHADFGEGIPLPAGYALNNGSGPVTGKFPKIPGASRYKVLRIDWDQKSLRPYPVGKGNYLVATLPQSSCAALTCSFTDDGASPVPYTIAAETLTSNCYMPRLDFWPGAIVISPARDMSTATYQDFSPPLEADVLGIGAIVSTVPPGAITGQAQTLIGTGATPQAAANLVGLSTNATYGAPAATILKAANSVQSAEDGLKGRLNFGHTGRQSGFTPLITLGDSDWVKTWAAGNHRPVADPNDLDLGYEGGIDTLYSRAQREIREYVGKLPDNKPQEKLTAASKIFNVPVTINGDLNIVGKCNGCERSDSRSASQFRNTLSIGMQSTAIAAKNICSAAACSAGQYRIAYYIDSVGSCSSPGNSSVALNISWKDETSSRSQTVPLSGSGITGNALSLGTTRNFGSGEIFLWSAGDAAISYSTTYTACGSGSGTYALRIFVEKLQ